jgi:NADPH:quinone reductase-like Zn-dependent oxidoreductase
MAAADQSLKMRAVRVHAYGGPEVMKVEEVPMPVPGAGERLVSLAAASVNPIDWKIRQGRLRSVFTLELPRILGRDGAGTDVGSGERVMGLGAPGRDGTHAEYAVLQAHSSCVIPPEVSFEDAAATGVAGLSAWIALTENAQLAAGDRVLIHAGAGGVGGFAIQIAALRGAEVWTTCSARNADWCRSLGAFKVIDYTKQNFTAPGQIFDAVLDTIGGPVHQASADVLKPGGKLVFLNADPVKPVARQDIKVMPTDVRATQKRLLSVLNLIVEGRLKVPIEARFPLSKAADAYELSRAGHARGKILLIPGIL